MHNVDTKQIDDDNLIFFHAQCSDNSFDSFAIESWWCIRNFHYTETNQKLRFLRALSSIFTFSYDFVPLRPDDFSLKIRKFEVRDHVRGIECPRSILILILEKLCIIFPECIPNCVDNFICYVKNNNECNNSYIHSCFRYWVSVVYNFRCIVLTNGCIQPILVEQLSLSTYELLNWS